MSVIFFLFKWILEKIKCIKRVNLSLNKRVILMVI